MIYFSSSTFSEDEMAGVLNGGGGGRGNENDLLRPIFDAIDSEGHGYITVEKFFEEMDRYSNTPTSAEKKVRYTLLRVII